MTVIIGMASFGPLAYVSYEYRTTLTSFAASARAPALENRGSENNRYFFSDPRDLRLQKI